MSNGVSKKSTDSDATAFRQKLGPRRSRQERWMRSLLERS